MLTFCQINLFLRRKPNFDIWKMLERPSQEARHDTYCSCGWWLMACCLSFSSTPYIDVIEIKYLLHMGFIGLNGQFYDQYYNCQLD
jgi:hypothetical protein